MAARGSYKDQGSPQHILVFELLENLHALMKAFPAGGGSGGKGLPSATSVGGCGGSGGKGLPSATSVGGCGGSGGKGLPSATSVGGCGGSGGKGLPSATSVGGCGGSGGKGLPSARKAGGFRSKSLPAWLTNELSGSTINTASSESTVSVTSFFMDEPSSSAV
jgi:hypothetical protein